MMNQIEKGCLTQPFCLYGGLKTLVLVLLPASISWQTKIVSLVFGFDIIFFVEEK